MREIHERALQRVAESNAMIVARWQLRAAGLSRDQINRLIASKRLAIVHPSVYHVGRSQLTYQQRLIAAVRAGGQQPGAVSHRAAAFRILLPGGIEIVEVTHLRWHRSQAEGIVVHETKYLGEIDVYEDGPLLVTTTARTIIDLGCSVSMGHLDQPTLRLAIQEAMRRNLVSIDRLRETADRLGAERRRGTREIEAALAAFDAQGQRCDSVAELQLLAILRDAGFDNVVTQFRVERGNGRFYLLDTYLPDFQIAPEFDPYKFHGGRPDYMKMANRTLELAQHGITRWAVTDDELDAGCPNLLAALRAASRLAG